MRILLSEGSSNSARQTIYGLGANHQIDLVDPSPWCQSRFSSRVRKRFSCPPISRDPLGYGKRVAELLRDGAYDVLFPTHEQVYLFSKFRDYFEELVGLAVPPFDAIRRVQSKVEFVDLMQTLGLPMPDGRVASAKSDLLDQRQFPCFLKLTHSTASLGVKKVDNKEELLTAVAEFEEAGVWNEGDPILIQQPAIGRQSEATAVFQHGRLIAVACNDVLATGIGGGPSLRRSALHPVVEGHLEMMGDELNWHGPLSLEYFYDETTQQPSYIEANPRIGESANHELAGVALCDAVARISTGERLTRSSSKVTPGIVTHTGFIVMIADAYNGANRRQLLGRLGNHWMRRGIYATAQSEMTRLREDFGSIVPATAVILRLLISPGSAKSLAKGTIDNYSLPYSAATLIDNLPLNALEENDE